MGWAFTYKPPVPPPAGELHHHPQWMRRDFPSHTVRTWYEVGYVHGFTIGVLTAIGVLFIAAAAWHLAWWLLR